MIYPKPIRSTWNQKFIPALNPTLHLKPFPTQDHLKPDDHKGADESGGAEGKVQALDLEAVQKTFESDVLKLATDMAAWSEYRSKVSAGERRIAITKLLKVKAENRRGSQAVVDWMDKNARFKANAYNEEHLSIAEVRQVASRTSKLGVGFKV